MAKQLKAIKDDITSVEKFEFEPIKGYPMLNWKGKRPFRSTQYYPAQLKEVHGEEVNGWLNEIYWGDNLQVMSHLLKKYRGKVDLVYIDPPFDSKADYKLKVSLKGKSTSNDLSTFEEKQYTDIWTNDEYLQFMYERLTLLKELISDRGSVFLHCDWRKVHFLKLILDELFGPNCFRGHITWRSMTSSGFKGKTSLGKSHDDILYYSKSPEEFIYNAIYIPYSEEYIEERFSKVDENGRRFKDEKIGTATTKETIERLKKEGRIYYTAAGNPRIKHYLDEAVGYPVDDVWTDIFGENSQSKEQTGYPTQKPVALLERVIKMASNPNDLIFDCFMGSGTTQAVAMKLGRKFIGADINLGAVQTTTKRLVNLSKELSGDEIAEPVQLTLAAEEEPVYGDGAKIDNYYTGFSVYNVNHYDIFRNPIQAKDLLIEALEIQPYPAGSIWDGEKDGRKVKIMPINRIATKADLNEIIANIPWKEYEKNHQDAPTKPVDYLILVCMGHEPDLAGALQMTLNNIKIDIEVVDILRDKTNLEFKRDSEAKIELKKDKVVIKNFYPMNLLQKLSLMKKDVEEWRELVDSVMIDFNYDGAVFTPTVVDVPEDDEMVAGEYEIPEDAGNIKIKITDLLSETFEKVIEYGNQ